MQENKQWITQKEPQQPKTITLVDKEILAAMSSKKLFDCGDEELIEICAGAVTIAFADLNKKSDEGLYEEVEYIISKLPGSLKRLFPSMRLHEVPLAVERGVFKEYGEYYGLNVAEFVRFCRAYMESQKRVDAAKATLKDPAENKPAPSPESIFYLYKNNLLDAYEKMKAGQNFEVNGPGLYDFCKKIGLVVFSTKEKYDMMADAAQLVIREYKLKLTVTVEDYHRKPLNRIVDILEEALKTEKPLPRDIADMVIAKSKYVTLKALMQEMEISELNFSEIIESKKELFLSL